MWNKTECQQPRMHERDRLTGIIVYFCQSWVYHLSTDKEAKSCNVAKYMFMKQERAQCEIILHR